MRFFLDHDVPVVIERVLSQAGHEVRKVIDVMETTAKDSEVFDYAVQHQFILISCNRDDFINLAVKKEHSGIIILIRRRTRIAECAALIQLLKNAGSTGIYQNINFA